MAASAYKLEITELQNQLEETESELETAANQDSAIAILRQLRSLQANKTAIIGKLKKREPPMLTTFIAVLKKSGVTRPREDVLTRIAANYAVQLAVSVSAPSLCRELYDRVSQLPATETELSVAQVYGLHLNGPFENTSLITAVSSDGSLKMVKMAGGREAKNSELITEWGVRNTVSSKQIHAVSGKRDELCLVMPRYVTTVEGLPKLPESLIASNMAKIVGALTEIHSHGFVHMDVKPQNIFVDMSGAWFLGDFGSMTTLGGAFVSSTEVYIPKDLSQSGNPPTQPWVDFAMALTCVYCLMKAPVNKCVASASPLPVDGVTFEELLKVVQGATDDGLQELGQKLIASVRSGLETSPGKA